MALSRRSSSQRRGGCANSYFRSSRPESGVSAPFSGTAESRMSAPTLGAAALRELRARPTTGTGSRWPPTSGGSGSAQRKLRSLASHGECHRDPEDRSQLGPIDGSLGHGLDPTPSGAPHTDLATQVGSGPVDHSLEREPERTGEVVSLAGDTVRSKALDFLVDHAEIAS
jgi:hypothetical protein